MFKSYLKIAFRSLLKNKAYTIINILGLSFGLGCCILILLFVQDETSYDTFYSNGEDTYRMVLERKYPEHVTNYAIIPGGFSEILAEEIPEVKASTRLVGFPNFSTIVKYEDNVFEEYYYFSADSNFFSILDFEILQGDAPTALKNPNTIVLTKSTAEKYFGKENPIGKNLEVNGNPIEVVAVMQDIPENSHIKFDFLSSTTNLGFLNNPNYISFSSYTYLKLEPGTNKELVESKLTGVVEKYASGQIEQNLGLSYAEYQAAGNGYIYSLQEISDIHLKSNMDAEIKPNGNIMYVYIFISIGAFILILAGINFVNLATAKSAERAKEVGLRKVMGSEKKHLIFQFLTESTFITFVSLILAVALIQLVLPFFNDLSDKTLAFELFSNTFTIPSLLVFVLSVGVLAGLYPAFYISSLKPIEVVKGKFKSNSKGKWLRNGLVVFQFSISMILITGTMVVYDQMEYIQNKRLGFDKESVLILERSNVVEQQESFRGALLNLPQVKSVASATSMPGGFFFGSQFQKPGESDVLTTKSLAVDDYYFETMGIKISEGRAFSEDFSDSLNLILNKVAVTSLGLENPIGATLSTSNPDQNGTIITTNYRVIGIVDDFNFESLRTNVTPLAIYSSESQFGFAGFTPIRYETSNLQQTIVDVERTWNNYAPGEPFIYSFLDSDLNRMYKSEKVSGTILSFFSSLAILIACVGLFGLAAYMAFQRTKEIGVRKVLGASIIGIIVLLSKEFMKLIGLSFILAIPVSYLLMNNWLENFAYRTELSIWTFIASGLLALIVALFTVSWQSIKAALTNPVDSLKTE
ncbi:MAG: ABC transporter permease [Balneolaceae bacterium]